MATRGRAAGENDADFTGFLISLFHFIIGRIDAANRLYLVVDKAGKLPLGLFVDFEAVAAGLFKNCKRMMEYGGFPQEGGSSLLNSSAFSGRGQAS